MRVAQLYDFDDIRIEERPVPAVGPREALVQTKACGICSGDILPWYIRKKAPLVLGHEPVGVVAAVGDEVSEFRPGDRVFVHHHAPCFACHHCERDNFTMCETWRRTSIVPGGMAEYFLVPEVNLRVDTLKLPDSVTYEDGVLIEPTACVVKSMQRSGLRKGDTILIMGLGVMGQIHVLLAREWGAGQIIATDRISFRCRTAMELGADHAIDFSKENLVERLRELTRGRMADVVIVGPGSIEAMMTGIECAGRGSTVLLFTPAAPGEYLQVEPNRLYMEEISLVASYSCGPRDTRRAVELIERGMVTAAKLVTHRYSLDETLVAYRKMVEANESLKAVVVFP